MNKKYKQNDKGKKNCDNERERKYVAEEKEKVKRDKCVVIYQEKRKQKQGMNTEGRQKRPLCTHSHKDSGVWWGEQYQKRIY